MPQWPSTRYRSFKRTRNVSPKCSLITNAIKYRSNRKPEIHVTTTDNGIEWVFQVADSGIGIDMKYADEIFGLFKRVHSGVGEDREDKTRFDGVGRGPYGITGVRMIPARTIPPHVTTHPDSLFISWFPLEKARCSESSRSFHLQGKYELLYKDRSQRATLLWLLSALHPSNGESASFSRGVRLSERSEGLWLVQCPFQSSFTGWTPVDLEHFLV